MSTRIISHQSERGQSLIELALTMTLLLILLAGLVDFGRAFFTYLAMRDAAQEGASYGSINPSATAQIQARVSDNSNFVGDLIASGDIDVTVTLIGAPCHDPTAGNMVQIDVNYEEFPITMPFLGTILGSDHIPLRTQIIDAIIAPACEGP